MKDMFKVDLGSIRVHKRVLAEITYNAVSEIKGLRLKSKDFISGLSGLLGINNYPAISVIVDKNNQVSIEVKVIIQYGMNIPQLAKQTQDVIREAIEKTVDIELKDIHVNVQGIEKGAISE